MFNFLILTLIFISYSFVSFADHVQKKNWKRQIVPYFDVLETKMLGKFKINIINYGKKKDNEQINFKKNQL